MASQNSIKRALLRHGHYLKLFSDRLLYVFTVPTLGGFSICQNGSHQTPPNELKALNPTRNTPGE